ncbi:MAG TPA: hypothetical protein VGK69_06620 [Gaiellaceae bacterium]
MGLDDRKALSEELSATIEGAVRGCGLELELLELVRMRLAQLNGCARCPDTRSKHEPARDKERPRQHRVAARRATSFCTVREQAALAWCEALTTPVQTRVLDDTYAQLAAEFAQEEIAALTLAVVAVDGWTRFQQYAASRDAAAAGDELAGVPFN